MASIYQRKDSTYFWLKYRDATGRLQCVSTKCRVGTAPEARRAQKMAAEKTVEELDSAPQRQTGAWHTWVPDFLRVRYGTRPATFERYTNAWSALAMFLAEREVEVPAQLTRQHCFNYVTWRTRPKLRRGKYRAGRNTAICDLKILRIILNEAVERGFCTGNPCIQLHIERANPAVKPELTEDHIAFIRAEIAKVAAPEKREFLSSSFEIARYQGCRLNETSLNPLTDVDLARGRISFQVKGGGTHVTRLHPKLVPLFERLQREGRAATWQRPVGASRQWAAIRWNKFFDAIGLRKSLPNVCFHSLRVTAATAMARSKVPENLAKQFIGHASTTVHRGYLRLRAEDLSDCTQAIG